MQQGILDSDVLINNPENLSNADIEQVRDQVLRVVRDFKDSWRNLARALQVVWSNKLYKHWGYETFDQYTAKEIKIRKHTAMKLIRSYQFLHQEEPGYIESESSEQEDSMPSLDVVNTLQRAKRQLPEEDYRRIKQDLLADKRDVREVKKDLTALIVQRRKDLDPEEERTKKGKVAINKFQETLRIFKRDAEALNLLPGKIVQDLDKLIAKIQEHISKESLG